MNLQEVNQMHTNQSNALFSFITEVSKLKKDEFKPTRQDEDDYANFSNKDNK